MPASRPPSRLDLTADCARCHALCCVLLPYRRAGGFGADKAGGVPCHHLRADDRCEIHADLPELGWPSCVTFDCFGAGQHVTQVTYAGASWRDASGEGELGEMAAVLSALRRVHEMLLHLDEVAERSPDPAAGALAQRLLVLRDATPVEILTTDLDDPSRAYPIITGECSGFPAWQRRPIEVGRAVAKPTPVFVKLDPAIVDEELERLG